MAQSSESRSSATGLELVPPTSGEGRGAEVGPPPVLKERKHNTDPLHKRLPPPSYPAAAEYRQFFAPGEAA